MQKIIGRVKGLALASLFVGFTTLGAFATNTVTLAWNPSLDGTVTGYHVYQGAVSHAYTNVVDVGSSLTNTVPGLKAGVTYFFAVTAYDLIGLESLFSNEVSYNVPTGLALLQARVTPTRQLQLTGTGPGGYAYRVLASSDLKNWSAIGSVTNSLTGSFQFNDPAGVTNVTRFYRVQQTSP